MVQRVAPFDLSVMVTGESGTEEMVARAIHYESRRATKAFITENIKPSSRQYPWIRFEYDEKEKLHRQAVEIGAFLSLMRAGGRSSIISISA